MGLDENVGLVLCVLGYTARSTGDDGCPGQAIRTVRVLQTIKEGSFLAFVGNLHTQYTIVAGWMTSRTPAYRPILYSRGHGQLVRRAQRSKQDQGGP